MEEAVEGSGNDFLQTVNGAILSIVHEAVKRTGCFVSPSVMGGAPIADS